VKNKSLLLFIFLSLVCSDERVYCDIYGKRTNDILLQWGELPTSVGTWRLFQLISILTNIDFFFIRTAYISNGKVMGWGNKAIQIRNVD
jgi:hypothetical protein